MSNLHALEENRESKDHKCRYKITPQKDTEKQLTCNNKNIGMTLKKQNIYPEWYYYTHHIKFLCS